MLKRSFHRFFAAIIFLQASLAGVEAGGIQKVLPHFIDTEGRHSLSPSLYERDAYQHFLRQNPAQRGGLRFDVLWKSQSGRKPLTLRVELRGSRSDPAVPVVMEKELKKAGLFRRWEVVVFAGLEYREFGELVAWRATLWSGSELVGEERSFLW